MPTPAINQSTIFANAELISSIDTLKDKQNKLLKEATQFYALFAAVVTYGFWEIDNLQALQQQLEKNIAHLGGEFKSTLHELSRQHHLLYNPSAHKEAINTLLLIAFDKKAEQIHFDHGVKTLLLTLASPIFYMMAKVLIDGFYKVINKPVENQHKIYLTKSEATVLFDELKQKNKDLEEIINRNNNFSKFLTMIAFSYALFKLFVEKKIDQQLLVIVYVFLFVGNKQIMTFARETKHWLYQYKLDNDLNERKKLLEKIVPTNAIVNIEKGETIYSSYLSLTIKGRHFENTSSPQEAHIIKNVLLKNGIKIISCRNKHIVIDANIRINNPEVLNTEIETALKKYADLKTFFKQVEALGKLFNLNVCAIPMSDQGNSLHQFYLNLPTDLIAKIDIEALTNLFPMSEMSTNRTFITLTGNQPANENAFRNALQTIRNIIKEYDQQKKKEVIATSVKEETEKQKNIQKPKKQTSPTKTELLLQKISEEKAKASSTPTDAVQWSTKRFDPKKPNDVKPLDGGNRIPTNTFFICSQLKKEDIGNDELFDKLQTMVKNPHLATSRKGQEGFVFTNQEVKDINGKTFTAGIKLKILGKFGKWRAYGEMEKSATGEQLYLIKGFGMH